MQVICSLVSITFDSPQHNLANNKNRIYKNLGYWSRNMLNFDFLKKGLAVRQTTRKDVSPSSYVSIRRTRIEWAKNTKIDASFDISNYFFLNWLFSWEFDKVFFSQNWKEEWNKETHRSKKISQFKTQVISFLNLKHTIEIDRRSVNNVKLGFLWF